MTATVTPGVPVVEDGQLISTNPASGVEVGRFPVADEEAVHAAVARAQEAARWWAELGFGARRERLLRWRTAIASRMEELAALINAEGGKPFAEGVVEITVALDHLNFAAKRARKVLGMRKVRSSLPVLEHSAWLEYQPYGVIGVIGPWNYPIHTPLGSISYALAAGNAVVFKPSEYTPAIGQWYVDLFNAIVPEQPVLQIIHGTGETGAALTTSAVNKVAFTGSTATGKKIMAACAATLKPVLLECGGKDPMIVAEDADVDAAADAATWGGLTNAGQACVAIERVYAADAVYDEFLAKVVARAGKLTVNGEPGADLGPITMPSQIDIIRRHIDDAIARGGRAVLGGPEAVQPPFVYPTILVDVPEDSAAVQEETFGPTLVINRVATADEAVARANDTKYGLGSAVFSRRQGMALARRIRSGMTSINSPLTFAGMPSLPFGGVGDSGIGRIHGDDGLREFGRSKAITRRRAKSLIAGMTFDRTDKDVNQIVKLMKLLYGRRPK